MPYLITTGSNRIYDLDTSISKKINDTCYLFCKYEYSAYQTIFKYKNKNEDFRKDFNKSFQNYFKYKFNVDDYYTNSFVNDAKGMYTSQEKSLRSYKEKLETDINNINKKIEKEIKTLNKYLKLRDNVTQYRKDKTFKLKTGMGHISFKKNIFIVRDLKIQRKTEYNINKFEYEYLNKQIKFLQNKISNLKYSLNYKTEKLDNLKLKPCVFYKKYLNNKQVFKDKKYNHFDISGRKDAGSGNFVFKAKYKETKTLIFKKTHSLKWIKKDIDYYDIEVKLIDGSIVVFKDIIFKHHGDELKNLLNEKIPLAYKLIRKTDKEGKTYYQIFLTLDLEYDKRLNESTETGTVALDFNNGHIDMTDIDGKGNLKKVKTIKYLTTGSKEENFQSLNKALNKVLKYACSVHKTIVIEDLDLSKSKQNSKYKEKMLNKIFHNLPYFRYKSLIEYKCLEKNLKLIKVSPSYTSFIGTVKYDNLKLNSHVKASYIIGRRGMGIKEKVPKQYKNLIPDNINNFKQWSIIYKHLNK